MKLKRLLDEFRSDGTSGIVSLFRLRVVGKNKRHGVRYQASASQWVHESLSSLNKDWSEWTFIDLGCGKGRTLVIAKQYDFKRIIGVEFAPALAKTARQNAPYAEVVIQDAADYVFPEGKLLVYLYNPFDEIVLRKVLEHMPKCLVVYVNPNHESLLREFGASLIKRGSSFSIWNWLAR